MYTAIVQVITRNANNDITIHEAHTFDARTKKRAEHRATRFCEKTWGPVEWESEFASGVRVTEAPELKVTYIVCDATNVPTVTVPTVTITGLTRVLNGLHTRAAGRLTVTDSDASGITLCPSNRQRLDHYGNDGDGWDDNGWTRNYESPLYSAVRVAVDTAFPNNTVAIEVGEKGYVYVTI